MKRGYFISGISEYLGSEFVFLFRSASDDVSDDVWAPQGAVIRQPFCYTFMPRDKPKRSSMRSISLTPFSPSLFILNKSSRFSFTRSFNRLIPTSSRGKAILIGISNSIRDDDKSCSIWSLISSYLSNELSGEGVVYMGTWLRSENKKERGTTPSPKSNQ